MVNTAGRRVDNSEFYRLLQAVYLQRDAELKQRFDRSLPFADALFDRWERARLLGFGEGTSIYNNALVFGDVRVGTKTWIGPYTILDGSGGLEIGSYCSISAGVHIYTHDSVKWALSGGSAEYEHGGVRIGDCCHIGAQAVIVKGITIGDHCVIGAGTFVNCHVPSFAIAVGQPCRVIGKVHVSESGEVKLDYSP